MLEQKFDKAKQLLEEDFAERHNPFQGLHLALLEDRMKDAAKRDAALLQVRNEGPGYRREATGRPRKELISLAELFMQDLAHGGKGEIDLDAAAKVRATADGTEQMNFNYFLASYLDLHGKTDKAIQYWKRCMACTGPMHNFNRTLAGAALVEHGLKPEDYAEIFRETNDTPQPKHRP